MTSSTLDACITAMPVVAFIVMTSLFLWAEIRSERDIQRVRDRQARKRRIAQLEMELFGETSDRASTPRGATTQETDA